LPIIFFRDYEAMNHQLLQTLVDKVRALEKSAGGTGRALPYESESSLMGYSWVFDELADEVDSKADPSYVLPPQRAAPRICHDVVLPEEVGENSITTLVGRRYNLRSRK
jgi:hypothetical protein